MGTFSPSVFMYKVSPKFSFNFCKWALKHLISVFLRAAFAAGYNEQEISGEVCFEVFPQPDMSNLGFLKTMPINGSDENHQKYISSLSSSSEKQDTLGPQHDYKTLEIQLHRCKMMQGHHRIVRWKLLISNFM